MHLPLLLPLLLLCPLHARCATRGAEDRIADLPGYGAPAFPMYSGFVQGATPDNQLHYWLATGTVEGLADTSRPLVVWFNGGPGSSSLLGMLQENGPLLVNASGGLFENPYAWTNVANLVALESPVGVGFSYCGAMKNGTGDCKPTDNTAAADAAAAIANLVHEKFPELGQNEVGVFITGESYAGVYVPTTAAQVLANNAASPDRAVNLKGIAAGDPCTDNESQKESMDMLWYGHKYGFVPDADFDLLWNQCGHRYPRGAADRGAPLRRTRAFAGLRGAASADCIAAERRFLMATSDGFSQTWPQAFVNDVSLYGPSALVSYTRKGSLNYRMAAWLNRPDVRAALHVEESPSKAWPGPSDGWEYTKVYAACNPDAAAGAPSMVDVYRAIVPKLETTVVFNGDTDPCVTYEGTRVAAYKVGFPQLEGGAYRPWFFNATASSVHVLSEKPLLYGPSLDLKAAGPQLGGHVVNFANNFQFLTVHGSGHMVPQFRPRAALHMLTRVLAQKPLAPPYVSDASLASMSEVAFSRYMDAWTSEASGAAYLN